MDNTINLLTLNLFLRPPGIHTNYSDYKDLRTQVFIEDFLPKFDIICLQEVFGTGSKRREKILKEASKKGFFTCAASKPKVTKGHFVDSGLVILSKFEILERGELTFSKGKGSDGFCSKGVLYVKLNLPSGPLNLFTTHLQASYLTESQKKFVEYRNIRKTQLIEMKKFVDKCVKSPDEAIVMAGDFNVDGRETRKKGQFEVAEEYIEFWNILSGNERMADVIRDLYGESLATFAAVDQFGCPLETVLTGADECCQDECLDYVLLKNFKVRLKQNIEIDEELTRVDKLAVAQLPITQLSDHLGIIFAFRMR